MILADGRSTSIAPQALAETTPLFQFGNFMPREGLALETQFATYAALYRAQPWVATVVNKISALIARLGVQVWDESALPNRTVDVSGPFAQLMAKPCDFMDPFSFWLWLASTIEIYGEAYLLKVRDGNRVTGLLPMHPARTQIKRDDRGELTYQFTGQPNELIPEDDVVPFRMYDPDGYMRGMSRLEPLRSTLMSEDSSRRAVAAWWRNGARPSLVLSTDKILGADGRQRLREAVAETHAGSGNTAKTAVFEDGITATRMQLSADEMQYIESRKLNREEVCAVFDIPPTAVGILDNATYSNITEQLRSVYRDSMAPRIVFIESVLNWHVGKEFYGAKMVRFAVSEVLRGDFETQADASVKLVQAGIMKPAEARPTFELNDAGPVADRLYANSALQPLASPAAPTAAPPAASTQVPAVNGEAATTVPAPQVAKYVRSINSWIGRGKTIQDAAQHFVDAYPADIDAIEEACERIIAKG